MEKCPESVFKVVSGGGVNGGGRWWSGGSVDCGDRWWSGDGVDGGGEWWWWMVMVNGGGGWWWCSSVVRSNVDISLLKYWLVVMLEWCGRL